MTDRPPGLGRHPGPGEITVATPLGRPLCTTLEHRRAHWRAEVVVLFGPLASWAALFPGCWGRSYPLCARCWQDTRRLVMQYHPAVVIHDVTVRTANGVLIPPAGKGSEVTSRSEVTSHGVIPAASDEPGPLPEHWAPEHP